MVRQAPHEYLRRGLSDGQYNTMVEKRHEAWQGARVINFVGARVGLTQGRRDTRGVGC